jgi:LmbE family N-acetylglucosaminyl deacetylase
MTALEPVVEDWQKALAIVAHPDDLEFGTAAAIARWTGQGKEIVYVMATSGEAGIDGLAPEKCGPLREAEQIESARIVGVDVVEFLGQSDGTIKYGVALRKVLTRRHQPEIVITNNFRETWDGDVVLTRPTTWPSGARRRPPYGTRPIGGSSPMPVSGGTASGRCWQPDRR